MRWEANFIYKKGTEELVTSVSYTYGFTENTVIKTTMETMKDESNIIKATITMKGKFGGKCL